MSFLLQPISFLFIIFFTYFLKRVGVFRKEYSMIVLKIIMNVTLPAVAVSAFAGFDGNFSLLFLILIGLFGALGSFFLMFLLTCRMEKEKRVYYVISASGYNVACYGMPIISAFFPAIGSLICIVFDLGNCMMIASGNYALASVLLKTEENDEKIRVMDIVKRFFSSVAVDVYLVLLVLCFFGISIPQRVVDFISPISAANAFLSMFMLGLLFTLPRQKSDWKSTFHILAFRFGVNGVLALILFHVLPFSLEIRQIVVLALMCPIGSMSPAFIEKCHGDGELASFTNSACTIASIIVMSVLAGWVFT